MRHSLLAGALVAGVYASPLVVRDLVTDYAYVTQVVTVTAAAAPAPTTAVAAVPTQNWWNWHWGQSTTSTPPPAPATTQAPAPATQAPAPVPTPEKPKPKPKPKPATTESVAAAAATPASAGTPSLSGYNDIVVAHHNKHRANHSAPDMSWDQALADTALKIAKTCNYAHNVQMDGGGYGQNIAAGAPSDNISSIITDHFYNDELPYFASFYNQATPSDMSDETFDKFGHYTQIVWKGSTKVGCAVYDCTGAGQGPNGLGSVAPNVPPYFTVCNYGPPGNYLGEFDKNVAQPEGMPTINWSWGL